MLAVAAVAVLGLGVYLFVEVRATPAQAQAPAGGQRPAAPPSDTPVVAAPSHDAPSAPPLHPTAAPAHDGPAPQLASDDTDSQPAFDPNAPLKPDVKLDAVMDQANKAYDHQDFEEARLIAGKVLQKDPKNIRMLRIMVSSTCIEGDSAAAQKYFELLPKGDREQMKARCDRYGVTFKDPAQ